MPPTLRKQRAAATAAAALPGAAVTQLDSDDDGGHDTRIAALESTVADLQRQLAAVTEKLARLAAGADPGEVAEEPFFPEVDLDEKHPIAEAPPQGASESHELRLRWGGELLHPSTHAKFVASDVYGVILACRGFIKARGALPAGLAQEVLTEPGRRQLVRLAEIGGRDSPENAAGYYIELLHYLDAYGPTLEDSLVGVPKFELDAGLIHIDAADVHLEVGRVLDGVEQAWELAKTTSKSKVTARVLVVEALLGRLPRALADAVRAKLGMGGGAKGATIVQPHLTFAVISKEVKKQLADMLNMPGVDLRALFLPGSAASGPTGGARSAPKVKSGASGEHGTTRPARVVASPAKGTAAGHRETRVGTAPTSAATGRDRAGCSNCRRGPQHRMPECTEPCSWFAKGKCNLGDKCPLSHGQPASRK